MPNQNTRPSEYKHASLETWNESRHPQSGERENAHE